MTNDDSGQERRPESPRYDDEIELADLARVIYRRRWVIVAVTIFVAVAAAAYTFTQPRVHQYQATLEIGELPEYISPVDPDLEGRPLADRSQHLIEPLEDVVFRIKQLGRGQDQTDNGRPAAEANSSEAVDSATLKKVTVTADEETGVVELTLRSSAPDGPDRVLGALLERIVRDHEKLLEAEQRIRQRDLEMAEAELRWLDKEPDRLQEEIDRLNKRQRAIEASLQRVEARLDQLQEALQVTSGGNPTEPVPALLISNQIESLDRRAQALHRALNFEIPERHRMLRNEAHEMNQRANAARQQLDRTRQALGEATPTRIVEPPVSSGTLVSPNYQLNIALGLVLGGFLSLFVAFLIEFWSNNKHKIVNG